MRELKFRAWEKDSERMIYSDDKEYLFMCDSSGKLVCWKQDGQDLLELHISAIMELTGLPDKNGREIYELDILKITIHSYSTGKEIAQKTLPVEFRNGKFGVEWAPGDFTALDGFSPQTTTFEVVGNVWEDGDLLNDCKVPKAN